VGLTTGGRCYRESGGRTEAEARRLLKARRKEIAADRFIGPEEERVTVAELLESYERQLLMKGAKGDGLLPRTRRPSSRRWGTSALLR
jgi:hypothetical protein